MRMVSLKNAVRLTEHDNEVSNRIASEQLDTIENVSVAPQKTGAGNIRWTCFLTIPEYLVQGK